MVPVARDAPIRDALGLRATSRNSRGNKSRDIPHMVAIHTVITFRPYDDDLLASLRVYKS